jgi:hypothetical protein
VIDSGYRLERCEVLTPIDPARPSAIAVEVMRSSGDVDHYPIELEGELYLVTAVVLPIRDLDARQASAELERGAHG